MSSLDATAKGKDGDVCVSNYNGKALALPPNSHFAINLSYGTDIKLILLPVD